jgi:uncharacterized protein (TIGR02246 family)
MEMLARALTVAVMLALTATPSIAQRTPARNLAAIDRATFVGNRVIAAFQQKDAAQVAALYTANGVFVGPDGSVAKGRSAIEAAQAKIINAWGDYSFTAQTREAGRIGNGIWAIADATIDSRRPTGPVTLHTHILNILVPAGHDWRIAVTSVGANVSPPQPQ